MECVLDESSTDEAECSRKLASRRRVPGVIKSLVNAKDLQFKCARVLHQTLLVPVFMYRVRQCYGKSRKYLDLGCKDGQPQRTARY